MPVDGDVRIRPTGGIHRVSRHRIRCAYIGGATLVIRTFPRADQLLGLMRDLHAAISPIHPGRQTVDSADGRVVQPELDPSSAVERPLVEMAVTADHLSSSLQSVKKTDQLQQPAPDGDMPLVIHAASDIELDVDDAVRQASAPKTKVVVLGGIGSTPGGTSSRKQRSPQGKPALQRRSRPRPYPEHRSRKTGPRRHNSPAYQRIMDVLENARVVWAIPISSTPRSTDASKSIHETAVF